MPALARLTSLPLMEGIALTPALLDHVLSGTAFQSFLLSQWKAWRKGGVEIPTPGLIPLAKILFKPCADPESVPRFLRVQ